MNIRVKQDEQLDSHTSLQSWHYIYSDPPPHRHLLGWEKLALHRVTQINGRDNGESNRSSSIQVLRSVWSTDIKMLSLDENQQWYTKRR
jgi:hypothetical protein